MMPGTRVVLEVGSYAAGQASLIAAIVCLSALPSCAAVIMLWLVKPDDRAKAVKDLAQVLSGQRAQKLVDRARRAVPLSQAGKRSRRNDQTEAEMRVGSLLGLAAGQPDTFCQSARPVRVATAPKPKRPTRHRSGRQASRKR